MTAGAAQTVLKAPGLVPEGPHGARRHGPLLWLLAAQILRAAARSRRILDTTPRRNRSARAAASGRLRAVALLRQGPGALARGAAKVPRRPRRHGASRRGHGRHAELDLRSQRCRPRAGRIAADPLLLHQGVVPNVNLAMAAGVAHRWNERQLCFRRCSTRISAARGRHRRGG